MGRYNTHPAQVADTITKKENTETGALHWNNKKSERDLKS